jgi:hypothetical protein
MSASGARLARRCAALATTVMIVAVPAFASGHGHVSRRPDLVVSRGGAVSAGGRRIRGSFTVRIAGPQGSREANRKVCPPAPSASRRAPTAAERSRSGPSLTTAAGSETSRSAGQAPPAPPAPAGTTRRPAIRSRFRRTPCSRCRTCRATTGSSFPTPITPPTRRRSSSSSGCTAAAGRGQAISTRSRPAATRATSRSRSAAVRTTAGRHLQVPRRPSCSHRGRDLSDRRRPQRGLPAHHCRVPGPAGRTTGPPLRRQHGHQWDRS